MSTSTQDSTFTVSLGGDVDSLVAYLPFEEVVAAFAGEVALSLVVIDVSQVGFMDSTGLGTLIRIRNEAADHGADCVLRGVQPRLRKLLDMTGLSADLTLV